MLKSPSHQPRTCPSNTIDVAITISPIFVNQPRTCPSNTPTFSTFASLSTAFYTFHSNWLYANQIKDLSPCFRFPCHQERLARNGRLVLRAVLFHIRRQARLPRPLRRAAGFHGVLARAGQPGQMVRQKLLL